MFASLDSNLLAGAIPTVAIVIGGAAANMVRKRRAASKLPSTQLHEDVKAHGLAITEIMGTLKGTVDILGRPRNDGLVQKVDNVETKVDGLTATVNEIAAGVKDIKRTGNGHA